MDARLVQAVLSIGMTQKQIKDPELSSSEWLSQREAEEIAAFAFLHGEEIMAKAGRKRMPDGGWSEDDLAWERAEIARRLGLRIVG